MSESRRRQKTEPNYGKAYRMKVIDVSDGKPRSILERTTPGPAMKDFGSFSACCGSCGNLILENMERNQVTGLIFKCYGCGAHNAAPVPSHLN